MSRKGTSEEEAIVRTIVKLIAGALILFFLILLPFVGFLLATGGDR